MVDVAEVAVVVVAAEDIEGTVFDWETCSGLIVDLVFVAHFL